MIDNSYNSPSFEHLVLLCKEATNGMELSEKARKRFYLD
jgi:hypothetical protein